MNEDVYALGLPYDFHPGYMRGSVHDAVVRSRRWSMSEYPYPVTLDWAHRPDSARWDEICIWVIDHFGLPGIKYVTEISAERMTWYFETIEDKLLFVVAWGDDTSRSKL